MRASWVALCIGFVGAGAAQADTIAIVHATLIDGARPAPLADATVVIRRSRIVAVGSSRDTPVPPNAHVIDARGDFLIPGLMDANVHLDMNIDAETLVRYEGRYDDIIVEAAQVALQAGITTVFDTWGPYDALVKARGRINRNEVAGSRIFFAGNIIGFDGPLSEDFLRRSIPAFTKAFAKRINAQWEQGMGRELQWYGPEEVGSKTAAYAARDMDFLKYGASGHREEAFITFSQRVQDAIVAAAHRAGKPIQAHAVSIESFDMALNAGVDIVTHCDMTGPYVRIPAATIAKMIAHKTACSVLPITSRRLEAMVAQGDDDMTAYFQIGRENIRNLLKGGVPLLVSTDSGLEKPDEAAESKEVRIDPRTRIGEGQFNALVALEELGMAPIEILKAATINTATAYRRDKDLGTLEPGKIADILILKRNPLASALNYRSVKVVIKDGAVVDRNALPSTPIITRRSTAAH